MTTTLAPNIPLIRKVLEQIDAHPELHNQYDFDSLPEGGCGTAFCFAGWAVVLSEGYRYDETTRTFQQDGGQVVNPGRTALLLLGIDEADAWAGQGLFSASSNRDRIGEIAEELAARAGVEL